MTTGDQQKLLTRDADLSGQRGSIGGQIITVERQSRQQSIKGFGAALSNAAAYLFFNSPQREQVIHYRLCDDRISADCVFDGLW